MGFEIVFHYICKMLFFAMLKRLFVCLITLVTFAPMCLGANGKFKLVIDAGHGGKDWGAPGAVSHEKNLTLKYALALGGMIERNCPDVRVSYTRKTDVFVPLKKRAEFANKKGADLFISVHINAVTGNRAVSGFQSYTLGRGQRTGDGGIHENIDVAKRENAVIYLEDNYKTVYKGFEPNSVESDIMFEFIADKNRERSIELSRLMQREVCRATGRRDGGSHQNNLAVLRLTSMPAVLLELGFISTPEEENFLNSDAGLDSYVKGMYNAFVYYKNKFDDNINVPYRTGKAAGRAKTVPVDPPAPAKQSTEPRPSQPTQPVDAPALSSPKTSGARPKTAGSGQKVSTPSISPSSTTQSKPVFKIQIFASKFTLRADDANFKGLKDCEFYEDGGLNKYTYGASNNYNEIYRLRKDILDKFPECFIIAFKDGKRMNVNQAIEEFKASR